MKRLQSYREKYVLALPLLPEGARAGAAMFCESKGEIKRGGITSLVGNVSDGLVGISEEMADLIKPLRFEILTRRLAHLLVKKRCET